MIDDGARLSYSIRGTSVNITNNMDGKVFVSSPSQAAPVMTIEKELLYNHIKTIQQLLASHNLNTFMYKPFAKVPNVAAVSIIEGDHYSYRFMVDGKCAELTEYAFRGQRGFNVNRLLRSLSYAYSVIMNTDPALKPKRDIVRRVADVGILVWVYGEHTLVCKDTNINGCTLINCLVDDDYYDIVLVSINMEDERCYIFSKGLTELFSVPLDNSILTYFHDDAEGL